jgi:hypothetical protein
VPHIVESHPYSHQNLSFRGRAATALPPPLAGDIFRTSLRRQSISSESNRTPCSLVCLPEPHLTAGERATAVRVWWGRLRAQM